MVHGCIAMCLCLFFQNFCPSFFGKFCPIIWIYSNWLKFCRVVYFYTLHTVSCLFFQNFCYSYFSGKFGFKLWSSLNWLKFGAGVHCYNVIVILIIIFSKVLSFIWFWEDLVPKSNVVAVDQNITFVHINNVHIINVICWLQSKATIFQNFLFKENDRANYVRYYVLYLC